MYCAFTGPKGVLYTYLYTVDLDHPIVIEPEGGGNDSAEVIIILLIIVIS